jgi:hypothetical protein
VSRPCDGEKHCMYECENTSNLIEHLRDQARGEIERDFQLSGVRRPDPAEVERRAEQTISWRAANILAYFLERFTPTIQ